MEGESQSKRLAPGPLVCSTSGDTVSQQKTLWPFCKRSKTEVDSVPSSRSSRLSYLSAVPGPFNTRFTQLAAELLQALQKERGRRGKAPSQSSGRPQVAKQTLQIEAGGPPTLIPSLTDALNSTSPVSRQVPPRLPPNIDGVLSTRLQFPAHTLSATRSLRSHTFLL